MSGKTYRNYEILIEGATPPSKNEVKKLHWAKRARMKREWEETIGWLIKKKRIPKLKKCELRVEICFKEERIRDPQNYLFDAIPDAFVRAGILVDDSPKYLKTNIPKIICGKQKYTKLVLEEHR